MNLDHYIKMLNEAQEKFIKELNTCIEILACEDRQEKVKHIRKLLDEIQNLKNALAEEDYPEWLINIDRAANNSVIASIELSNRNGLLTSLIENIQNAKNHEWNNDIDFENIYAMYRKNSKIEELFLKLINCISEIIENDHIDNDIVENGLKKIIMMIKYNKGKSIFSDISLVEFITLFLKNIALEILKKIPGMDVIVNSICSTVSELNTEINSIRNKTAEAITDQAKIEVRYLNNGQKNISFPSNYELQKIDFQV